MVGEQASDYIICQADRQGGSWETYWGSIFVLSSILLLNSETAFLCSFFLLPMTWKFLHVRGEYKKSVARFAF